MNNYDSDIIATAHAVLSSDLALSGRSVAAVASVIQAERDRCERIALIAVRAGDSSAISITGQLIAEAIRNGDAT